MEMSASYTGPVKLFLWKTLWNEKTLQLTLSENSTAYMTFVTKYCL